MSDLSGLFGVGGGALEAVNDQMKYNQNYRTLDQQYNQDQAMNPLRVQHQQGLNDEQAARLPGLVGQSQTQAAQGQVDSAGVNDKIAVNQSNAMEQMNKNQLEQLNGYAQKASQIGAALEHVPVEQRQATLQGLAQQYGIQTNHPLFQSLLSIPPEQLPQKLAEIGGNMALTTNDFLQKKQLLEDKGANAVDAAETRGKSAMEVARINHEHDLEKYRLMLQNKESHLNITQTIAKLLGVPSDQRDADWNKRYSDAMQSEATLRSAGSSANLPVDMINGEKPGSTSSRTQGTVDNVTGGNKPAAPAGARPEINAAIKEWGTYDPNTYEYGVNPATGKFARRKK